MSRSFHTIFCDDVRQEINGKFSIIGQFTRHLFVESFPTVIPKLCIVVQACSDIDTPAKRYSIEIRQNNETIVLQDVDAAAITESLPVEKDQPEYSYTPYFTQSIFVISPLHVDQKKYIDIYITVDSETVQAPGLIIDTGPTSLVMA